MLELYRAVYGETLGRDEWLEQWRWKYRRNPAGKPVIWLAEAGGRLVGQYPLNPVRMKVGEEIFTGVQMVELMTHPDYRRRGVSLALARKALDEARDRGLGLAYGFPNRMAYPTHMMAGYADVGATAAWIRPFNAGNILKRRLKSGLLAGAGGAFAGAILKAFYREVAAPAAEGLSVSEVASFDGRADELWGVVSRQHRIAVVRDMGYLNWRYAEVPGVKFTIYIAEKAGKLLGYAVLKCEEQGGLVFGRIFELVVLPGQGAVARHLLHRAGEHFQRAGADLIIYRLLGNRAYNRYLRKGGFIRAGWLGSRARFIARPASPDIPVALLAAKENWFVQSGDSDAV